MLFPLLIAAISTVLAADEPVTRSGGRLTTAEKSALKERFRDRCHAMREDHVWGREDWVFGLENGDSLVLNACNIGAYNPSVLVLLRDSDGIFRLASLPSLSVETGSRKADRIDHTTVIAAEPAQPRDQIVYPRFDPDSGILRATSKGRGLGDSRTDIAWTLDGKTGTFSLLAWMTDHSTDGHFKPACAWPVQAEGPCPGHESILTEDESAMAYQGFQ